MKRGGAKQGDMAVPGWVATCGEGRHACMITGESVRALDWDLKRLILGFETVGEFPL